MHHRRVQLDPSNPGRQTESFETLLRQRVIGQSDAVRSVVDIYHMHQAGMNPPGRPIGNFLFLGPTGTGKTRIVEAVAEVLYDNPQSVIKIDCAEFQHSHEIAKLIGSPPGYLGHRETHPMLSQEVLAQYHNDRHQVSLLLFDEIEKASDALWNLLLGILDKGKLRLGDNRMVDFSKVMIFMTSNLGAREMDKISNPSHGFGLGSGSQTTNEQELSSQMNRSAIGAAQRTFTPEFINRLDKTVVFSPLGECELRQILDLELAMVQNRIFAARCERSFVFEFTEVAKDFVLKQGYDQRYGARHLKRAIERLLVQPLSNLIATCQVCPGDLIQVDFSRDNLAFYRLQQGLSPATMVQSAMFGYLPNPVRADLRGGSREQVRQSSRRS